MQPVNPLHPRFVRFEPGDASGVTLPCIYFNNQQPDHIDHMAATQLGAKTVRVATYPEDKDLIERVARACTYRKIQKLPKIVIADAKSPNAASVNGNTFMFTTSILKSMNGDELDAIIGHEIAHHRHSLRDTSTRFLFFFGLELAAATVLATLGNRYGHKIPLLRHYSENPFMAGMATHYAFAAVPIALYTRSMEYESDREGAEYAGPDHMISALKTLDTEVDKLTQKFKERPLKERIVPTALHALRAVLYPIPDHPSTPARIEAIEKHRPYAERLAAERLAAIETQNQK